MDVCASDGDEDDVKITKVVKSRAISWVSSSFDSFGLDSQPQVQRSQTTPLSKHVTVPQTFSSKLGKQRSESQTSIKKAFTSVSLSRKRPRTSNEKTSCMHALFHPKSVLKPFTELELWSDKYSPKSRAELAVHKKKVLEIAEWLEKAISQRKRGGPMPILLLTGPPGSGKTACIRVLCAELACSIQEWTSTSDQAAVQWETADASGRSEYSKVDVYQSQSQGAVFHNFLLRANKYQALDLFGGGKLDAKIHSSSGPDRGSSSGGEGKSVVLVEELPNVFYRDTSQFHEILRKYKRCRKSPLIFIVSDSNNSSGISKLFPKDLTSQLHVTTISMNPVAPTLLVKLLTQVSSAEEGKFPMPSTALIESVALSSSGDIRSALNTLQFACGKDTKDLKSLCLPAAKSQLKKQGSSSSARLKYGSSREEIGDQSREGFESTLGGKDKAVFLFHSVGKILHFKRGKPVEDPRVPALPSHLSHFERDRLLLNPEDVAFKSQLSGDHLTSFLHENYVEFLSTVEDLERAAEYFSDADCISALWTAREELQSYSVSVAMRGFIHSNSEIVRHDSQRRNLGWLPLHKSRWFTASKQASENIMTARQLFKGYHWEPVVLCTEILPYISLTNPTLHDPGQISFIHEMTTLSRSTQVSRAHLERLDEKEVVNTADEEEVDAIGNQKLEDENEIEVDTDLLGSQSNLQAVMKGDEVDQEEDFVIEEFDDDDDFGDFVF